MKVNKNWKVITFKELIPGRLTNLILSHHIHGVFNIINWYGVLNINDDNFNQSFNLLNDVLQNASLHKEKVVIAGDLNMITNANLKGSSLTTQDQTLISWINQHNLIDLVPYNPSPSYRQHDSKGICSKSRPNHILVNWIDNFTNWDFNIKHLHKGIATSIPIQLQSSQPWNQKYNKLVISPKIIKNKHKLINKLLKQGDLTQFDTVANNFNKVIQKFGRPVKFTNALLTDDRRFRIADYKHKMLRFNYKYNRNSNDWKKHDEWNSATLELAILNSIKHKKAILLQLLRERKEAFIKKVNNLQTKTPYSFVF
ncbi:hypothetical protein ABK040_002185 [Willaertia magna]